MAFGEVLRFELRYQLRRRTTWIFVLAIGVVAGLFTIGNFLPDAIQSQFFVNGPFVIAVVTVLSSLVWLLIAPSVAGEAAGRDVEARMYPLLYSAPLHKLDFLGGRFAAAFLINALILLAAPIGIVIALYTTDVPPEVLGPFRLDAFATAYGFLALPNAFCATAIQFLVATRSGRPRSAYLGSVFLFFTSYILSIAIGVLFGRMDIARLLDAMGVVNVVGEASRQWTPAEKSTRLIVLEGTVLWNRLLWLGVGVAALAFNYLRFRFAHRATTDGWRLPFLRRKPQPVVLPQTRAALAVPRVTRQFSLATRLRQVRAIAWTSYRALAKSPGGIVLLLVVPTVTLLVMPDVMQLGDVPLLPVSAKVVHALTAPLTNPQTPWIIAPLLLVLFTGDLVWREREARMHDISDATPVPEWVSLVGKYLGIVLLLMVWRVLLIAAGLLGQASLGGVEVDLGLYLQTIFGMQLVDYLLFTALALCVHSLVSQKHLGYLAVLLCYGAIILLPLIGWRHHLLTYSSAPGWSYTDMGGFGNVRPWLWLKLYWTGWALLLLVVGQLFWMRGREQAVGARIRLARLRFTRPTGLVAVGSAIATLALGGFTFYNTNILNRYETPTDLERQQVHYEQRYARYRDLPQPRVERTALKLELYPAQRSLDLQVIYRLVNRTALPIDSIHLTAGPAAPIDSVTLSGRRAAPPILDPEAGYAIVPLDAPLLPGDSVELRIDLHHRVRGFANGGITSPVVENGTMLVSTEWLPTIGYQWSRELFGPPDRRSYGLAPRGSYPSARDPRAVHDMKGDERTRLDITIGTTPDQIAVAPGQLQREWSSDGRRYFRYVTDSAVGNEFRLLSARYAVAERQAHGVSLQVYHHPSHTANVERVLRSTTDALAYHGEQFGAYPHSLLRFAEHPGYSGTLHADEGLITMEEESSFLSQRRDSLDLPYATTAHEVAHQWWGNRLTPAHVAGAPILTESLAWYTAMMTVARARGDAELQRLRHFFRQPYPIAPHRSNTPLLDGLDPYLSYRKGPFALYALRQYIGEAQVNSALRQLLATYPPGVAPLPTTLDLYRELTAVTPDSLHYLLHDLFEANTFWHLATRAAFAEPDPAGGWRVTLEVDARKEVVGLDGTETDIPMHDLIQIGIYQGARTLYLAPHRITTGRQLITVTVAERPSRAGIDPEVLLLDLNEGDNVLEVRGEK